MGHDKNEGNDEKKDDASESTEALSRDASESSFNMTEDDDDAHIELGPKISIREHLEKDKYINTVWKTGLKVDSSKQMLGTFSPQAEPYIHVMTEETTPSGMFARGSYSAKTKFLDDDNKCYLELNYTFDIQKDWAK
nr:Rho GDP-dissociation inhibitor 1-like [Tanacetum cinerariifolium]GFA49340.1 Rho GDP-dissociation inhibitor 1-like [Tanacetum cinerariifolium]